MIRSPIHPVMRPLARAVMGPQSAANADPILALFSGGELGAYYDPSDSSTVFQDAAMTTPAGANDPVGALMDKSGNGNHATQATAAARPTSVAIDAVQVLQPDFVDDVISAPNTLATGDLLIETPHGWMLSQDQHLNAANFNLPLVWNSKALVHQGLTPAQVASLSSTLRGDQQWGLFLSPDTVFTNLQFNGDGTAKTVRFVGANGATFDQVFTNAAISSIDVAPEGLTAPVLMMLPIVLGESGGGKFIRLFGNNLTGSIPDWSAWTSGDDVRLADNNLTGAIPDWSGWTSGKDIVLRINNLTGSIPDWSTWTNGANIFLDINNLTGSIPDWSTWTSGNVIYLQVNNLTGSIPDWSAWTSGNDIRLYSNNLTGSIPDWSTWSSGSLIWLYDNSLTDVLGTSIPATMLNLQLQNNALTQTAVDRVLTSLDAAGGTGGSVRLEGGTNAVPSAAGLAAKTSLEGKGWTVTVNV